MVLEASGQRTVELELRDWIAVRGTFVGADGRPLADHTIVPLHAVADFKPPTADWILTMTSVTTDRDGHFELRRVAPDTNVLLVSSPSGQFSAVPLRARPGDTRDLGRVTVTMER